MRAFTLLQVATSALAWEVFQNEPDTGFEEYLQKKGWTAGTRPDLADIQGIPDFDFAARQTLSHDQYSFYRVGAGSEWAYRNNLAVWEKARLRPHQLAGITGLNETMGVTILGYNFSSPIFISPAARAGYGDPAGELNFVDAAAENNILYMAAYYANKTIEEIGEQKRKHNNTLNGPQVTFQQFYATDDHDAVWDIFQRAEANNAKALVWTIDAPATSSRQRAARYSSSVSRLQAAVLDWDLYEEMKNHTSLPIILKGITTVEDAKKAVEKGVPAIMLSNHGGRQVDYSPSPLEIAFEIHHNAPEIFNQIEVLADSGIRYGDDVVKLLALGVKAVGMGRPFLHSNIYGLDGVNKAISLINTEIYNDAAQVGVTDFHNIPISILNTRALERDVYIVPTSN
uniref:FMN hydroxy acid dehydrogenase domain-containing protein n=1 Tax=Bionectria ochroleuca TaxID=29856 RepID=A0A8H7K6F9_BIOOC